MRTTYCSLSPIPQTCIQKRFWTCHDFPWVCPCFLKGCTPWYLVRLVKKRCAYKWPNVDSSTHLRSQYKQNPYLRSIFVAKMISHSASDTWREIQKQYDDTCPQSCPHSNLMSPLCTIILVFHFRRTSLCHWVPFVGDSFDRDPRGRGGHRIHPARQAAFQDKH